MVMAILFALAGSPVDHVPSTEVRAEKLICLLTLADVAKIKIWYQNMNVNPSQVQSARQTRVGHSQEGEIISWL